VSQLWNGLEFPPQSLPASTKRPTAAGYIGRHQAPGRPLALPQPHAWIFTDRVAGVLAPYAQQTNRLGEARMLVGRALGGRPGQRLLSRLGMRTSRHTLLRHVTRTARRSISQNMIRVLGVDDWGWSRGRSYGTVLVDRERREVTDLLPTRSADVLCAWLIQHPEVVVVSRDRQGVYAEGASRGTPQALQIADRG
jgi:transposase